MGCITLTTLVVNSALLMKTIGPATSLVGFFRKWSRRIGKLETMKKKVAKMTPFIVKLVKLGLQSQDSKLAAVDVHLDKDTTMIVLGLMYKVMTHRKRTLLVEKNKIGMVVDIFVATGFTLQLRCSPLLYS